MTVNNGSLYFHSSQGEKRLVKENIDEENVMKEIVAYVKHLNPKFHIYYTRSWKDSNGSTIFDVGSHSEFFIFTPNR